MRLKISLGQLDIKLGDPSANLDTVRIMVAEASRRGSDIIVFPELWSTGYDLENAATHASRINEGIFVDLIYLAQQYDMHILGSSLSLLGEGQYGNTAVLFNSNGEAVGVYSKTHLFRLMAEEKYLTAGDALTICDTAWGKAGLAICYDLRFPELFRHYALAGAKMVFIPSEWPNPRLAHWQTLLRARAIENQMYIIACNRVGEAKGNSFFGHSCIIDPWGEIVIEGGAGEMLLTAVIDTAKVDEVRAQIPVFADRRPDLYG